MAGNPFGRILKSIWAPAACFRLNLEEAMATWEEVVQGVASWRSLARELGMRDTDLVDFSPAFDSDL